MTNGHKWLGVCAVHTCIICELGVKLYFTSVSSWIDNNKTHKSINHYMELGKICSDNLTPFNHYFQLFFQLFLQPRWKRYHELILSVFHARREYKLFQKSKAQENEARGSCLAVRILRYELEKRLKAVKHKVY